MHPAPGQGFVQAEQVDLQASRYDTDADGLHREEFGTCAVQLRDRASGTLLPNGCPVPHKAPVVQAWR